MFPDELREQPDAGGILRVEEEGSDVFRDFIKVQLEAAADKPVFKAGRAFDPKLGLEIARIWLGFGPEKKGVKDVATHRPGAGNNAKNFCHSYKLFYHHNSNLILEPQRLAVKRPAYCVRPAFYLKSEKRLFNSFSPRLDRPA